MNLTAPNVPGIYLKLDRGAVSWFPGQVPVARVRQDRVTVNTGPAPYHGGNRYPGYDVFHPEAEMSADRC